MSGLKELTEDTTDRQEQRSRVAHLCSYSFFVFYRALPATTHPALQKMQFKLKDDREGHRLVQMQFYSLEEEAERVQGLLDLRQVGAESKARIVAFCEEAVLMELLGLAARLGLDLAHTPLILAYAHPHSDFASFTGWNGAQLDLSAVRLIDVEEAAKRWIHSSQERVDVWSVRMSVGEGGRVERQAGSGFEAVEEGEVERRFLSHVSLGHHARLGERYGARQVEAERPRANRLIYGWESFKNFCCLGPATLRSSTGVVSINYLDEKGDSLEILKHLRDYDGSEESERETARVIRSDRGILSLVVASIDRYHGNKLPAHLNCKPGDGRAEIIVYEGVSKCRRLATVGGEILLRVESEEPIFVQVGEAVYRCWGCRELRVRQVGRIRACINRDVLEC